MQVVIYIVLIGSAALCFVLMGMLMKMSNDVQKRNMKEMENLITGIETEEIDTYINRHRIQPRGTVPAGSQSRVGRKNGVSTKFRSGGANTNDADGLLGLDILDDVAIYHSDHDRGNRHDRSDQERTDTIGTCETDRSGHSKESGRGSRETDGWLHEHSRHAENAPVGLSTRTEPELGDGVRGESYGGGSTDSGSTDSGGSSDSGSSSSFD